MDTRIQLNAIVKRSMPDVGVDLKKLPTDAWAVEASVVHKATLMASDELIAAAPYEYLEYVGDRFVHMMRQQAVKSFGLPKLEEHRVYVETGYRFAPLERLMQFDTRDDGKAVIDMDLLEFLLTSTRYESRATFAAKQRY